MSTQQEQQASASAMPAGVTDPNYKPPPGRLGNLTVPQQHALEKFRKELQDQGAFVPERMNDALLLRLLSCSTCHIFAFSHFHHNGHLIYFIPASYLQILTSTQMGRGVGDADDLRS